MSTSKNEEVRQKLLSVLRERFRMNDPSFTEADLSVLCKLEWKDAEGIAESLEHNTHLVKLCMSFGDTFICPGAAMFFTHFLRKSQSLRSLEIQGFGVNAQDQDDISLILEAISHSQSLTDLSLYNVAFIRPALLEKVLAKTRTLKKLEVIERDREGETLEAAKAFRRGFQQNQTLEAVDWNGKLMLEESLYGLYDHRKLKTLNLGGGLDIPTSKGLRSFLHHNEVLENIRLGASSTIIAHILLGLAYNKGVQNVELCLIEYDSSDSEEAWVEMLQKNKTMKSMDLSVVHCDLGQKCASAIARGLCDNTSLEKLDLDGCLIEGEFHGPSWKAMLQQNGSLEELSLEDCKLDDDNAQDLALGLLCNTSLKRLNLDLNHIGSAGALAIARDIRRSNALEYLSLSWNLFTGPERGSLVRELWQSQCLKCVGLPHMELFRDEDATMFPDGLPKNSSFESLALSGCGLRLDDCRAVVESLYGNTRLRKLNLSFNRMRLDGSFVVALREMRATLEVLNLAGNDVTMGGIRELADGLAHYTSLRELNLQQCNLDNEGLLELGQALTENSTLATLDVRDNAFDKDAVARFLRLLPQMKGLKELGISTVEDTDGSVALLIIDGMRVNTSLQKISAGEDRDWCDQSNFPVHIKDEIRFYLKLNRNGRRFLQPPLSKSIPASLWPHILAKMSGDASQLFYFLRNKPNIVPFKEKKTSQSRVASDQPAVELLSS